MKRRICKWLCHRCWTLENILLKVQVWLDDHRPSIGELTIHIYWFLGDISMRLFIAYYEGSDDEVRDALELNHGDELDFYSPRQREIILRRSEWEGAI